MNNKLPPQIQFPAHLVLDFGLPLAHQVVCRAYTVEKLTLWQQQNARDLTAVALRMEKQHRARLEGTLYYISDPAVITKLDREYQVGYAFDRVEVPILLPYKTPEGDLTPAKANIYLGRTEYWEGVIAYDKITNLGRGREFDLAPVASHDHRLLNNRFCLLPEPYPCSPPREMNPKVAEHVAWKNRSESQRIERRYQEWLAAQRREARNHRFNKVKAFLRE